MPGDKNLGVTVSRTLIPTLPADYLSRRRLFPLIDNNQSGTTFLIAPDGYGKTSLVAEWAQNQESNVIWMTVTNSDSINEMSAMMIVATRQVIPGFAPWFENDQPMRPTEVVRRWGNELLQTGRNFVYVLDNLRNENESDVDIAVQLMEQFPSNVHFVAIRRDQVDSIYATCASRGPIKVLTINDLKFTEEDIANLAANAGEELNDETRKILDVAHGWPAAVSLLLAHIQAHGEKFDLESLMSSSNEPLRALAMLVIQNLDESIVCACERLSVLESFTLAQAKLILAGDYSVDLINAIAHKGEIFTLSRAPQAGYVFSPMVRQIFLEGLRKRSEEKNEIHKKLIAYFEDLGMQSEAMNQAFEAGDEVKINELFPSAARIKQAQGHGGELIRWAEHLGTSSEDGALKRSTVLATGYLADLDFSRAQSEISKISLLAEQSPGKEFFLQFAAAASCYSLISLGKFAELEEALKRVKIGKSDCYLGVDDQINLLRLQATKRYIFNDSDGVEESYNAAQELAKLTSLDTSHTFMLSIEALWLHQQGQYKRAHEVATISLGQHQRNRFVGNHGPLDVMFVIARCLLEFSRPQEALAILEQIRSYSYQWKQWHWYLHADKHIIEFLSFNENNREALERVKRARDFIATLEMDNKLEELVDFSEMSPRRRLKDFDRLETLVNRTSDTRDSRTYRMAVDEYRGRKKATEDAKNLPEKTPRDLIWKFLTQASFNVDVEKIALPAIHNAMKVGAQVGARETFLRQRDEMANFIIRIANDFPTVYNEELATAMAERMRERGKSVDEGKQQLTKRELEILRQLSTGRTLTVIAAELHISQNTMKTHLKNLYKKIGAEGRHDAVEKAKSNFLI
jgi:ATP/maltotriose-dependent transcriptional regulator MalT